jgi:PPK2 family polyphosphate:nucleotide phosphotransferase
MPSRKQPAPRDFDRRYRVEPKGFRLTSRDCADSFGLDKESAKPVEKRVRERLVDLQERLHAQDRWSVLVILQAMDAAGKDGTLKHLLSGLLPQAFQVWSFKAPSEEELDHDFLWRGLVRLPERGRIGVHNRSWYEEVLVVRVHPAILARQKTPKRLVTPRLWEERFESIRDVERHLARNGTVVRKFFLHVSKEEQRQRFLARLDDPEKRWKFSPADVRERAHWADYLRAYEDAIRATSTPEAPWYVIPADRKWFMRLAVSSIVLEALEGLGLAYPQPQISSGSELAAARALLASPASGRTAKAARRR